MGVRHVLPAGFPTGTAAGKAAADDYRADHLHVPFKVSMLLANGNTVLTPGNSLTVGTELFATSKLTRNLIDLSQATQVRLVAMVTALGSSATAAVKLQYRTQSGEAATWAGADAGVSCVLGNGSAGTTHDSGWQTLIAGARNDSIIVAAVVGVVFGGTGPSLGSLTAYFR